MPERRVPFDAPKTTPGRDPDKSNSIVLDDSISRTQGNFHRVDESIELENLNSCNGTFVSDERIERRTLLQNRVIVRLGALLFKHFAHDDIENAFHDRIYRLATIDAATDSFNRNDLVQTLASEFAFARACERSLSFIHDDLDRFKEVNDGHGHGHGCSDSVLRESGGLAKTCMRRCDVVGRLGGE